MRWRHLDDDFRRRRQASGARLLPINVAVRNGCDLLLGHQRARCAIDDNFFTRGHLEARHAVGDLEHAARAVDLYVEAEYVEETGGQGDSYFYAWTELAFRPVEWLRVGVVGQRTRVVDAARDVQPGVFGQVEIGKATIGVYAFNPDAASRYTIVSLGLSF